MGFGEAIRSVFSKYATFSGRARRSEYWYWQLFVFLVPMAFLVVEFVVVMATFDPEEPFASDLILPLQGLSWLWSAGTLLPGLAVFVRRFHDVGKSAWTVLWPLPGAVLALVGVVVMATGNLTGIILVAVGFLVMIGGSIYQFVLLVSPSNLGSNRYGPQPGAPIETPPLPAEVI
jgi:uncharacterized membrane protein YhaH (DUF805 family)